MAKNIDECGLGPTVGQAKKCLADPGLRPKKQSPANRPGCTIQPKPTKLLPTKSARPIGQSLTNCRKCAYFPTAHFRLLCMKRSAIPYWIEICLALSFTCSFLGRRSFKTPFSYLACIPFASMRSSRLKLRLKLLKENSLRMVL